MCLLVEDHPHLPPRVYRWQGTPLYVHANAMSCKQLIQEYLLKNSTFKPDVSPTRLEEAVRWRKLVQELKHYSIEPVAFAHVSRVSTLDVHIRADESDEEEDVRSRGIQSSSDPSLVRSKN